VQWNKAGAVNFFIGVYVIPTSTKNASNSPCGREALDFYAGKLENAAGRHVETLKN
jgi:hypothetical protein